MYITTHKRVNKVMLIHGKAIPKTKQHRNCQSNVQKGTMIPNNQGAIEYRPPTRILSKVRHRHNKTYNWKITIKCNINAYKKREKKMPNFVWGTYR